MKNIQSNLDVVDFSNFKIRDRFTNFVSGEPAFWFGIQTDKGDGALIQVCMVVLPGALAARL